MTLGRGMHPKGSLTSMTLERNLWSPHRGRRHVLGHVRDVHIALIRAAREIMGLDVFLCGRWRHMHLVAKFFVA